MKDYSTTKYSHPMAGYIYEEIVSHGLSDESAEGLMGRNWDRVGRRIVVEDDQGFVTLLTYHDAETAAGIMYMVREDRDHDLEFWEDEGEYIDAQHRAEDDDYDGSEYGMTYA